jgi:hypothetical protein
MRPRTLRLDNYCQDPMIVTLDNARGSPNLEGQLEYGMMRDQPSDLRSMHLFGDNNKKRVIAPKHCYHRIVVRLLFI